MMSKEIRDRLFLKGLKTVFQYIEGEEGVASHNPLREAAIRLLSEPVNDPADGLDITPPPPIDPERLASIPQLDSLEQVGKLANDINRNIELLTGREELAEHAHKLDQLRQANGAKRCEHMMITGKTCGSPAVRGLMWCHYHGQAHAPIFEFPVLEDVDSLQVAHTQLLQHVIAKRVRPEEARVLLQILQSATKILLEAGENE